MDEVATRRKTIFRHSKGKIGKPYLVPGVNALFIEKKGVRHFTIFSRGTPYV